MREGLILSSLLEILAPILVSCENKEAFPSSVAGVVSHSGKVEKDFIFCAVEGTAADGHIFIPAALEKGAKVIVHSHGENLPEGVVSIKVKVRLTFGNVNRG